MGCSFSVTGVSKGQGNNTKKIKTDMNNIYLIQSDDTNCWIFGGFFDFLKILYIMKQT